MFHNFKTIAIIDDDADFLEYLSTLLTRWGYGVRSFSEAHSATKEGALDDIALLISDVYMPDFDGIEVLMQCKRQYPDIPVIGISGHKYFEILHYMQRLGAVSVFEKPVDPNALKHEVQKIIDKPLPIRSARSRA